MTPHLKALKYTISRLCDFSARNALGTASSASTTKASCLIRNSQGDQYQMSVDYNAVNSCYTLRLTAYPSTSLCSQGFWTAKQISWARAHEQYSRLSPSGTCRNFYFSRQIVVSQPSNFTEFCISVKNYLKILLGVRMCSCLQNLVVDEHELCFDCGLKLPEDAFAKHYCVICLETSISPVQRMTCCSQILHTKCVQKHFETDSRCPLCRAETADEEDRTEISEQSVQDSWA